MTETATKATHTPGPWVACNNEVHDKITERDEHGARIGDTPNRIVVVEFPYLDAAGQATNARLIAAAPEMFDALMAVLAWCGSRSVNIKDVVRAAIAKAEAAP